MFPAPLFLVSLILATPIIFIFDGPIIYGLVAATAGISVATVALRMQSGEADFLSYVIRPLALVLAIPALWMLFQVLPISNLANPIWKSAAVALGQPLGGSISIDPGATLISFARYVSMVAILFVAAAVAVDRRRAERVLFTLTAATTLIALMDLPSIYGNFTFLNKIAVGPLIATSTNCAGLGIIIAAAGAFRELEHKQTHKGGSVYRFPLIFGACLIAGVICSVAVLINGPTQTYFAVICGIATFAISITIRYFRIGRWGFSAIVSVVLVIAIALIFFQPNKQTMDPTLAYAARSPVSLITVTRNILADTNWAGTGAGTFTAVLPIYRDMNELATGQMAPTAMAAIAVEMGQPFLWAMVITTIIVIVALLRGALRRGRDSFYSIAAASCAETVLLLAFGNAGVLSTPTTVIVAAAVGLGIAQSKSRSGSN